MFQDETGAEIYISYKANLSCFVGGLAFFINACAICWLHFTNK